MRFRLLGPLEVADGDRRLALGGGKQRALLAVLLLNPNAVVATERLIDLLWGEAPPATVAKSVHVYVSRLRKQLGAGRILTRPPGYELRVEAGELDIARFEQLLHEAAGAEPETAASRLRAALALWRGPALADFTYESFAQAPIARLEELRLVAVEQRVDADLARGVHIGLVAELDALHTEHPLRERLCGQLMLALQRSGRQAEALETYRAACKARRDELGLEPSRELRELQRAILEQDPRLEIRPPAHRGPGREAAPFVGRADELAELIGGLDDAFAGRGRLFLITGEAGIGKSRIAEELTARARQRGALVLVGRCWEAGGAPAYWPWVQSLRAYVQALDPEVLRAQLGATVADLAQLLPDLRLLFPDASAAPQLDAAGARFRVFDAVAELLRAASVSAPLVIVLDDLHAADASSLLLLQFVARELGSARVLVIGAHRDADPFAEQPLNELLAEVAREPVTRRLRLGGLSAEDVAEYLDRTAAGIASPELAVALHERTDGNALFLSELMRLLALDGARSVPTPGSTFAVPQSVRAVIARRVGRLSEECIRLLALASVLGREFSVTALARLAALPDGRLLDALDDALRASILAEAPGAPGRLRFAHALVRDTLYARHAPARRMRLHGDTLAALEELYRDNPGPHLAELAHHATAAGDIGKGVSYARRAGDRALALLAYEEAARLYRAAVEALERGVVTDEQLHCALLLELGDAEARAGNTPAAMAVALDGGRIARRLGLPRELARSASIYGGVFSWKRAGDDARLIPLLEEALAVLPDDEVELRARLLARLAGALRDDPARARRDRLSAEAVHEARRSGNPAALARALNGRASAIVAPDTIDESLALADELQGLADRIGDLENLADAHAIRLIVHQQLGARTEWEADLAAVEAAAEALRQPTQLWEAKAARATCALFAGRLAEAESLIEEALAIGGRAQPAEAIPIHRLQRCVLSDMRGGLVDVEPALAKIVSQYPARPVLRCALAHTKARLGRRAEAGQALDGLARDRFATLPFDNEWLLGMSFLAETSALLGDVETAPVLYSLLLPWAGFNAADHPEAMRGSVARYLGLLAATLGDWSGARRHFQLAVEMNERMGARPWLAHTQRDFAVMCLARGAPGDDDRAHDLAGRANATYRELDMTGWVERAAQPPRLASQER